MNEEEEFYEDDDGYNHIESLPDDLDDEEIDILFKAIAAGARDLDSGQVSEVYLLDGTSIILEGLDPIRLASVLGARGVAALEDPSGRTVVVFAHGVAAIIGSEDDE